MAILCILCLLQKKKVCTSHGKELAQHHLPRSLLQLCSAWWLSVYCGCKRNWAAASWVPSAITLSLPQNICEGITCLHLEHERYLMQLWSAFVMTHSHGEWCSEGCGCKRNWAAASWVLSAITLSLPQNICEGITCLHLEHERYLMQLWSAFVMTHSHGEWCSEGCGCKRNWATASWVPSAIRLPYKSVTPVSPSEGITCLH